VAISPIPGDSVKIGLYREHSGKASALALAAAPANSPAPDHFGLGQESGLRLFIDPRTHSISRIAMSERPRIVYTAETGTHHFRAAIGDMLRGARGA